MLQMIDRDINFHILQKKIKIAGLLLAATVGRKIHIPRHGRHDSGAVTAVLSTGRQEKRHCRNPQILIECGEEGVMWIKYG